MTEINYTNRYNFKQTSLWKWVKICLNILVDMLGEGVFMDYTLIGERIRKSRKEINMTQEEFAEAIGVSVGYINQIETGKKCFNLKRFNEIVTIFDKPVSYFIEGTDSPEQSTIKEIADLLNNVDKDKLNMIKNVILAMVES
ncbi:MAG: helix-turn-helix transcriptional regulator [Clostridiales bacterium]|nr:helix-turn-helix transcriptional regulator [Clostridiales bacterium]